MRGGAIFALTFVACVHTPVQPPVVVAMKPPAPPPPEKLVDLGTLPSIAESVAARPKRVMALDWYHAADYAPTDEDLPYEAEIVKTRIDRDLDHDLLVCTAHGPDTWFANYVVEGNAGAPRVFRRGGSRSNTFNLPLWSMHRGDPLVISIVREKHAPAIVHGTFDGTLPIVATGDRNSIQCDLVDPKSIARAATRMVKEATAAVASAEKLSDVAVDYADPLEASSTDDFLASVYADELAALVGWAHPLVTGLLARIDAAAAAWRVARQPMFRAAYDGATGEARFGDALAVRVHDPACKRGQRFTPVEGAGWAFVRITLTLGLTRSPTEPGCGFSVDLVNQGTSAVPVKDALRALRIVTTAQSFYVQVEQGSMRANPPTQDWSVIAPHETRTARLFANVDPKALDKEVLVVVSDETHGTGPKREVRPVARLR